MTLPSSPNSISLKQIQTEFGGADPISIGEYYRNGSYTTSNNTNVPVDSTIHPPIKFSNFYGAAREILVVVSATTTNLNARTLFEATYPGSWAANVPKKLIINSGVIIGSSITSLYALIIPSAFSSTITVNNNGSIQGAGGPGGGDGGNAIFAGAAGISINNQGTIYAGGGGGGNGGRGGSITAAKTNTLTGTRTSISLSQYSNNLTITVAGANGGNGGADGIYAGGLGGSGRSGTFSINTNNGYITVYAGTKGSDGASNVSSTTLGGGKGTNQNGTNGGNGGNGGNTGPIGTSGAGGGGGSATVVTFSSSTSSYGPNNIVAGGGGGGGGGSYGHVGRNEERSFLRRNEEGSYPWLYSEQVYLNRTFSLTVFDGLSGRQGGIKAAIPTEEPQYVDQKNGGGAGGGGGGANYAPVSYPGPSYGGGYGGRDKGTYAPFWDTNPLGITEMIAATGGFGGASVYNSSRFTLLSSGDNDGRNNGNGYVTINYTTTTIGGNGGNGGNGRGYNQAPSNAPTLGQPGGPTVGNNGAGNGGVGGNGGEWGQSGSPGTQGTTSSTGVAGPNEGSGRLAGYYIFGNSNVTWINLGTVAGRVG